MQIGISWFGLIFVGLIVIAVGLAALKLLSLLVNALMGRRKSPQPAKAAAWSGVLTAMIVSATVFAGLLVIGLKSYRTVQSAAHEHPAVLNAQAQESEPLLEHAADKRARQLAAAVEQEQADLVNSLVRSTDKNVHPTEEQAAVLEARKAQLQQLVSSIGQFVRSNLEMVGDKQCATIFGQAAKSDNGDVVVFDKDVFAERGAVVDAATAAHGIFFERTPAGRRLPRIDNPGARAVNRRGKFPRQRRDTGEALNKIQRGAFRRE